MLAKGNGGSLDRKYSLSLQMLRKEMRTKMIGSAPHHWRCLGIMEGEYSPSLEMLKEVEIQWMGSAPHHANHINSKNCSADGVLPIACVHVNQKSYSINGERSLCDTSSNRISTSCKFFSLSASPWFGTNWKFHF
jgi:hypothetical protein